MIKKISFILVFSMLVMTTACSGNVQNKNSDNEIAEQNLTTPNPIEDEIINKEVVTPAIELSATIELLIYTLNENTKEVESRVALVSQDTEITPELIVNLVLDSLADGMLNVEVDEVTTQEDAVIVNFNKDYLSVISNDNIIETAILDVIAQSLVDNFVEEYPKVIFKINGEAYTSKQYKFGLNDVYLDGTKMK
ncbi:MAG: hypothetical protein ACK5JH_00260 [Anaerocolumna sp.]